MNSPVLSLRASQRLPTLLTAALLVAACCLVAAPSSAAEAVAGLPMAKPADVGMDAKVLDELTASMKGFVDDGKLSGFVSVIARHGKVVQWETYGKQDVDAGTPMADDSIFRIYSMTKPITGVALMTFFEEGKFTLDDPVEKFLPEFKNMQVAKADGPDGMPEVEAPHHKMTIRELVSHTGGLTYGLFSRSQVDLLYVKKGVLDPNSSLAEMTKKLGEIPLWAQPGSKWQYSVSVDVQGRLVEVFGGKPFDEVLKERIFEPLGMVDSDFWVPEPKADRLTVLYVPGNDGKLQPQSSAEFLKKPGLLNGGGGLVSTASDYLRFAQMLLNGGELDGKRILKPETVELMHTNQLPSNIPNINPMMGNPGNVFGVDFAIVQDPDPNVDHERAKGEFWWYGIGGTWFGVNPTQDLITVGMIQSRGGRGAREIRFLHKRMAYEAITD